MKKLLLALLLVFFASNVEAANRYWVGGGSSTNWNATGNTNWSATDGGANNASVPGVADQVYFTSSSGSGTANISASITVGSIDATGYTGTWTQANSTTLTVDTSSLSSSLFTLSAGMTYAPSASSQAIAFVGTGSDITVTTAGHTLGSVSINSVSTQVFLQDALTLRSDAGLTLTQGELYTDGFAITSATFNGSSANTKTLDMTGTVWTITSSTLNSNPWNLNVTGTTLTATGSTLNLSGSGGNGGRAYLFGSSLTYGAVVFNYLKNPSTVYTWANDLIADSVLLNGPLAFATSSVRTITANSITSDTTSGGILMTVSSGSNGHFELSVPSGTVALSKASLLAVQASGGATFTATDSYDLGGNSGITITPPSGGGASGGYIIGGN